ncbi:uncharacterized protein [Dendrobates tinctorius]|uniref:uncharacterized protein isoform X4 n=1 Tax=Dendrobates tinctorius TaxID=92724 RepID=UPI003CCA26CB
MDLSITTVIWGDGRDDPTKGTLILPRNISAIYILLTPSDETNEPQWRSWNRFIYIAVMVVLIILVLVGLYVRKNAD